MNEKKAKRLPVFYQDGEVPSGYYNEINPYEEPPKMPYNLPELAKYARSAGKKIAELTKDELQIFAKRK